MKRNLLRLINIGEFSSFVDWQNPSSSFVIGQIPCISCNSCCDLDVCRDLILDREWLVLFTAL